MPDIRCLGIGTGGGDAPGLNAVIRAAVKSAILKYHWKVIGIPDGFDGLIWPERTFELTLKSVSGILPRGAAHTPTRYIVNYKPCENFLARAALTNCFGAFPGSAVPARLRAGAGTCVGSHVRFGGTGVAARSSRGRLH